MAERLKYQKTDAEVKILEHATRHDERPEVRQRATAIRMLVLLTTLVRPELVLTLSIFNTQVLPAPLVPPEPDYYVSRRADYIGLAYTTGVEPHFAAFFNTGRNGTNQHYLGPGGDDATCSSSAGCIRNWNWWGDNLSKLLVPKSGWLLNDPPWGSRWQGSNYQADLWYD